MVYTRVDRCEHCGKILIGGDWHLDDEGITLCTLHYPLAFQHMGEEEPEDDSRT